MPRRTLLMLFLAGFAGCSTMKSTMLNRLDNDMMVGNSNGEPGCHCDAKPFEGMPITVRVPTHLDVEITETYYLAIVDGRLQELNTEHRNLDINSMLVETEKVFTVDFPRPASGVLKYNVKMGDKQDAQYFKQIKNEITDNTIQDVAKAIAKVAPVLAKPASAGDFQTSAAIKDQLISEKRTIAWKRFDIDSPDFEEQVQFFVEDNLNKCHNCHRNGTPATFVPIPSSPRENPPAKTPPPMPETSSAPAPTT
jgi:hypothetical protein